MAHICAVAHYGDGGIIGSNLIMEKLFQTVSLGALLPVVCCERERIFLSAKAKLSQVFCRALSTRLVSGFCNP